MRKDGATGAAATLPSGAGARWTQVGAVAELLRCQGIACTGLEADGVELGAGVVDQGRQVGGAGIGLVAEPKDGSCAVVILSGGVALSTGVGAGGGGGQLVSIIVFVLCQVAG